MNGTVQTVKGPLDAALLGKTMTHEHLLWDQICWWGGDPEELSLREFVHKPVSMEILGQIYYYPHQNLDNIQQFSVDLAISEALHLKKAGGGTLVDVSSLGLGRDPSALLAVSEATGLNIIMGSSYYMSTARPPEMRDWSKEQLAEHISAEFRDGVKLTGIRPGVIGEISISDMNNPVEVKGIQAGAIAQKQTGAPLYIHPPMFEPKGNQILDILEKEGADLSKVVLCHCDPTLADFEYHNSLAKRGVYIEYDQFGLEFYLSIGVFLPRDIERIRAIRRQIELGNLPHILVSQDVCFKTCLVQYGGWGYGHILRDLVPIMKREGFTEQELNTILITNPARLLVF
jgi:phosphotriesterase-related protein